jgi:site-specific recombinase XerC
MDSDPRQAAHRCPGHAALQLFRDRQHVGTGAAKQYLAAIRHLFDWLVIVQIVPHIPAASVRGPSHTTKKDKTPVLVATEA